MLLGERDIAKCGFLKLKPGVIYKGHLFELRLNFYFDIPEVNRATPMAAINNINNSCFENDYLRPHAEPILRPTVSRPVCPGIRPTSGTHLDQWTGRPGNYSCSVITRLNKKITLNDRCGNCSCSVMTKQNQSHHTDRVHNGQHRPVSQNQILDILPDSAERGDTLLRASSELHDATTHKTGLLTEIVSIGRPPIAKCVHRMSPKSVTCFWSWNTRWERHGQLRIRSFQAHCANKS
jgi:hypothetical protein